MSIGYIPKYGYYIYFKGIKNDFDLIKNFSLNKKEFQKELILKYNAKLVKVFENFNHNSHKETFFDNKEDAKRAEEWLDSINIMKK